MPMLKLQSEHNQFSGDWVQLSHQFFIGQIVTFALFLDIFQLLVDLIYLTLLWDGLQSKLNVCALQLDPFLPELVYIFECWL